MWRRVLPVAGRWCRLVSGNAIRETLETIGCTYSEGHATYVLSCPFCAGKKGQFFVNKATGGVVCRPCMVKGSWSEFCEWLSFSVDGKSGNISEVLSRKAKCSPTASSENTCVSLSGNAPAASPENAFEKFWSSCISWNECQEEEIVRNSLGIEKLKSSFLMNYNVQTALLDDHGTPCVVFPYHSSAGTSCARLQSIVDDSQNTWVPKDSSHGLFGLNTIPGEADQVVITSSEFNAIAVNQETNMPAISVCGGTNGLHSKVLSELSRFSRIYLWLGSEPQAKGDAAEFARKLGTTRCHLVSSSGSALEELNEGVDLRVVLKNSRPMSYKSIITFSQVKEDILRELHNPSKFCGVKWKRYPELNRILKGHRGGEVTIFTGPTGAGKTTLLSELSLDLCQQGVKTLWGSFEIKNEKLMKTMLRQLSGINLENKDMNLLQHWAGQMEGLPMYFLSYYGSTDTEVVIDALSFAADIYGIQHVIIDNLQFMAGLTTDLVFKMMPLQHLEDLHLQETFMLPLLYTPERRHTIQI